MGHPLNHDFICLSAVRQAHALVSDVLREGDLAIDATCGNGLDTIFLAEIVGDDGHVFAFDIQSSAIQCTSDRLDREEISSRVTLLLSDHARLGEFIPEDMIGGIRVVMFNLGYLPGGDTTITTRPEATIPALKAGAEILARGGLMTVVVYTGHEGGAEEGRSVESALSELDSRAFDVRTIRQINRGGNPPYLIAVHRQG
jgi:SAM-dependent methyltransferase